MLADVGCPGGDHDIIQEMRFVSVGFALRGGRSNESRSISLDGGTIQRASRDWDDELVNALINYPWKPSYGRNQ